MKVLLVGGGSGGHVTPLLAVAHKLKQKLPNVDIIAATDRGNKFAHLLSTSDDISEVTKISAGKLRRYHNQSFLHQLLDVHTIALNIRDSFRVLAGTFQAISLLRSTRPDVIFIKGGFVGVPVGIAARWQGIPFVTHDSDTLPGLANRIIARWATMHAVGMPERFYAYPKAKTIQVGIPIGNVYESVSEKLKTAYRQELKVPATAKLVVVISGSLGAQHLNTIVGQALPELIARIPDLYLIHQTGDKTVGLPPETDRYRQIVFADDLYKYTGAADVVVARAGATSMAELAVQGRAAIVVPAPQLSGGHQVANGKHMTENEAAVVLDEATLMADVTPFVDETEALLSDTKRRAHLCENLAKLYKTDAANAIADIIIKTTKLA